MKYLLKLDFLGQMFGFEDNGSLHHKTNEGAFFSFIIITFMLITSILLGRDVYKRENPNMYFSEDYNKEYKMNLNNFPVMFYFTHKNSEIKNSKEYFNLKLDFRTEDGESQGSKDLIIVECRNVISKFTNQEVIKEYLNNSNYTFYCLNFDENNEDVIQNSITQELYLTFSLTKKQEELINRNKDEIVVEDELKIHTIFIQS